MTTSASIDLAAERERSFARQEERGRPERMRARARRVLALQWDAGPKELFETIEKEWPGKPARWRCELLDLCRDVQLEERKTITPDPDIDMPKTKLTSEESEQLRAVIRRELTRDLDVGYQEIHRVACAEVTGKIAELSRSWFYNNFLSPIRTELQSEAAASGSGQRCIIQEVRNGSHPGVAEATELAQLSYNSGGGTTSALDVQIGGGHYKDLPIQPVEFCQRNGLTFCESSVIKYVTRHRHKNGRQDIEKAIHFLQLLLEIEYPADA